VLRGEPDDVARIEIVSPSSTSFEMKAKCLLYLNASRTEFWTCDLKGNMRFYDRAGELEASRLAPGFPTLVSLG
jgi:Uma2 family endonuclease